MRGKIKRTKFESVAIETEKLYEKNGKDAFDEIVDYLSRKLNRNDISEDEFGILSEHYTGLCLGLD